MCVCVYIGMCMFVCLWVHVCGCQRTISVIYQKLVILFPLFKDFILFFFFKLRAYVCGFVYVSSGIHRGQNWLSDHLELELI